MKQDRSQNLRIARLEDRIARLEDRVTKLERALKAKAPEPREDDPATPLYDEATGDFRSPQ